MRKKEIYVQLAEKHVQLQSCYDQRVKTYGIDNTISRRFNQGISALKQVLHTQSHGYVLDLIEDFNNIIVADNRAARLMNEVVILLTLLLAEAPNESDRHRRLPLGSSPRPQTKDSDRMRFFRRRMPTKPVPIPEATAEEAETETDDEPVTFV